MFGKDDLVGTRERVPSHEEITKTPLQFANWFQYTLCILFYRTAEAQKVQSRCRYCTPWEESHLILYILLVPFNM